MGRERLATQFHRDFFKGSLLLSEACLSSESLMGDGADDTPTSILQRR